MASDAIAQAIPGQTFESASAQGSAEFGTSVDTGVYIASHPADTANAIHSAAVKTTVGVMEGDRGASSDTINFFGQLVVGLKTGPGLSKELMDAAKKSTVAKLVTRGRVAHITEGKSGEPMIEFHDREVVNDLEESFNRGRAEKNIVDVGSGEATAGAGFRMNPSGPTRLVARDPVEIAAQRRLNVIDGDRGAYAPGEAGAAAEMENYLRGTLERAPSGTSADYVVTSGNYSGARIDFKLTPDSFAQASKINTYFDKTFPKFSQSISDKLSATNGVDIMPFDTRFLTPNNRQMLFDFVDGLPLSSQKKIIYLVH
jgi:hypothetical protein